MKLGKADLSDEAIQETDFLVTQALRRMWEYQLLEARIEGREPPDPPPEPLDYFKNWDRGEDPPSGNLPSGIPRKPRLPTDGNEVALLLPVDDPDK